MLFQDTHLAVVLMPFLIAAVLYSYIRRRSLAKCPNETAMAWAELRISLEVIGFMGVVLWFLLPVTATLSTFGYPDTVGAIEDSSKLLRVLQGYNRALVRTISIVHFSMLLVLILLLGPLYRLSKVKTSETSRPRSQAND